MKLNYVSLRHMFLLFAVFLVSGCGTYRWSEEVQLSDGRVITVKRTETYGGGGGLGDSCNACVLKSTRLQFLLEGKTYDWKGIDPSFSPMILDVVDGAPVIVALPYRDSCAKDVENPNKYYLYTYNVWVDGGWSKTNIFEGKFTKQRNLLSSPRRDNVVISKKNEILKELRVQKQYREIVEDGSLRPDGCSAWR